MKLKAIEKSNLVDQVQERILETIREHRLGVGDSLPPELQLTEDLGVSRTVVREALSRLRMLGLLESRKKRGLVVSEPNIFGGCSHILDRAFLSDETQRGLFELRLTLEMGLADLLFLRKTSEAVAVLEDIVERESKAKTEATRIKLEIKFHTEIYRMCGNAALSQFQALLQPFFRQVKSKGGEEQETQVTHADLVKELKNGTANSFRKVMREHLEPHFSTIDG